MKIHLLGASCTGVTTLGKALAAQLGIPYVDSDDYFWIKTDPPFTTKRNPGERNQLVLQNLTKTGSWILGGSVIHWGDNLFPAFDLIVFLYLPKELRIERLKKRERERYGEVIYNDPVRRQQFDQFLAWAADYDDNSGLANRTLKAHKEWLAGIDDPFIEINGDHTTEERVAIILKRLQEEKT